MTTTQPINVPEPAHKARPGPSPFTTSSAPSGKFYYSSHPSLSVPNFSQYCIFYRYGAHYYERIEDSPHFCCKHSASKSWWQHPSFISRPELELSAYSSTQHERGTRFPQVSQITHYSRRQAPQVSF